MDRRLEHVTAARGARERVDRRERALQRPGRVEGVAHDLDRRVQRPAVGLLLIHDPPDHACGKEGYRHRHEDDGAEGQRDGVAPQAPGHRAPWSPYCRGLHADRAAHLSYFLYAAVAADSSLLATPLASDGFETKSWNSFHSPCPAVAPNAAGCRSDM